MSNNARLILTSFRNDEVVPWDFLLLSVLLTGVLLGLLSSIAFVLKKKSSVNKILRKIRSCRVVEPHRRPKISTKTNFSFYSIKSLKMSNLFVLVILIFFLVIFLVVFFVFQRFVLFVVVIVRCSTFLRLLFLVNDRWSSVNKVIRTIQTYIIVVAHLSRWFLSENEKWESVRKTGCRQVHEQKVKRVDTLPERSSTVNIRLDDSWLGLSSGLVRQFNLNETDSWRWRWSLFQCTQENIG